MLRRHAGTSTAKKSVKRQLTISRKGWDVVWAAKKQKLLNILEDAYPNVLNIDDLARCVLASPLSFFSRARMDAQCVHLQFSVL